MLTFEEFVKHSWKDRGLGAVGSEYTNNLWESQKTLYVHQDSGWYKRYHRWILAGCPMPVQDVTYEFVSAFVKAPPRPMRRILNA